MTNFPGGGGGGHLNVTLQGGAHFLRICTNCLGKKIAFQYPVLELQIAVISRKQLGKQ